MNRRGFLLTGAGVAGTLVVGWAVTPPPPRLELDRGVLPTAPAEVQLNGWLTIAADGGVGIAVPRSEMGQGVHTALPMLLAEELCCDWNRVLVIAAPVDQMYANVAILVDALPFHPDMQGALRDGAEWIVAKMARQMTPMITGGSTSVKDAWNTMRVAGACAREMLVAAAAARMGVPASQCRAAGGWVTHASGNKLGYGELAAAAAQLTPNVAPKLKDPRDYTLIGKAIPRTDLELKVTGSAKFGLDVRLPDMLYASIRMTPTVGGNWSGWVDGIAEAMPGVKAVVGLDLGLAGAPPGIAVVAEHWYQAESALKALEKDIRWEPGANIGLDSAQISACFAAALAGEPGDTFHSAGHLAEGFDQAVKVIEARYEVPYLAHAAMEPQNCTALVKDGRVEVWAPTQSTALAQWIAAHAAGVDKSAVTVHTTFLGGGFGRRIEIDLVAQAVGIAARVPGRPVQLIWKREEDTQHDFYRPASACSVRAGIDAAGNITAWEQKIASGSVVESLVGRIGLVFMGLDTLPQRLTLALKTAGTPDKSNAEGSSDLPYEFGSQRVSAVTVKHPVPLGFWRSVGHSQNAFYVETFIDELATAAGSDPVQFRRRLLKNHPRHLAVLDLAAAKADWGKPLPAGSARGIALHQSFNTIVCQVAEVSLVQEGGKPVPKVARVVCAVDCGVAVNPGIINQQMESGIIFGLSAALYGRIEIKAGQVVQSNFNDYRVLRMREAPLVETYIVPSAAHPTGVGEPATPAIAPAVCNALFALTGKRIRTLPVAL